MTAQFTRITRAASVRARPRRRGRPVAALGSILGVWIALRVVFWQSPLALPVEFVPDNLDIPSSFAMPVEPRTAEPEPSQILPRAFGQPDGEWTRAPIDPQIGQPLPDAPLSNAPLSNAQGQLRDQQLRDQGEWNSISARGAGRYENAPPVAARRIVGHNLMLAAGLSQLPMSPLLEQYLQGRGPVALARTYRSSSSIPVFAPAAAQRFENESNQAARPERWSLDAWALWRDDMVSTPVASTQPSYGRSQVGAVLRYSLAPASGHRPQAYLRASAALDGPQEREAALGLSARPVASVPVRLAAETRVSDRAANTEVRASAYAVSEFPPLELPAGLTGEAYVQAGYVTGKFDTGFVDGQARVTRELTSDDNYRLTAGAGAWGGAQRGASRVDVGPSASVTFRLGNESYGRLSADYRIRVAGDAAPASGPALTLSAGF